jgi:hypothetical protein
VRGSGSGPWHVGSIVHDAGCRLFRRAIQRRGHFRHFSIIHALNADAISDTAVLVEPMFLVPIHSDHWIKRWFQCSVSLRLQPAGSIWILGTDEVIRGGMSGSPIIAPDGTVIGVLSNSDGIEEEPSRTGGPEPGIIRDLPAGLVRRLGAAMENG